MSEAVFAALVWMCMENGRAHLKRGFVEKEAESFSQACSDVGSEKFKKRSDKVGIVRLGHE